jgi:hypothetical protein
MDKHQMNQLEQFLKNATQGLFGKRNLEVQEELEAHVLERARKHELLGLSREDAISRSLTELGSASVIRSGLQRTYLAKPIFTLIWLGLIFLGFTELPNPEQQRLPIFNPSLKIETMPIPLARAGMAQVKSIPLAKPDDAVVAAIPLAKPPAQPMSRLEEQFLRPNKPR